MRYGDAGLAYVTAKGRFESSLSNAVPQHFASSENPVCGERPKANFLPPSSCCVAAFVLLPFMLGAAFSELKRQSAGRSCRSLHTRKWLH